MSPAEYPREQLTRLRRAATFNPKPDIAQFDLDQPVSFVPMEAIGERGTLDLSHERVAREVLNGYTYFEDGDVIRAKVTPCFENGKGAVASGLRNGRAFGTTELIVMRPHENADAKFLYYVTQSHEFRLRGESTLYGAHGVRRLSEDFVREYLAWLPPRHAQWAIADYLDRETGRIDALIAAKRRMVELLEERWLGTIDEVTLGAGSPSPRRDTGFQWLGSVPADWAVERLKFLAHMESGHTPDKKIEAYWVDCTIPWITLNDVGLLQHEWTIIEPANAINELGMANSAAHILPEGTVVLSRDATVGRSAILGRPMAVSQHFVGWVPGSRLMAEYLLHVLRGPMQRHFATLTAGATSATIGMPELKDLVVPVPRIDEQKRIIAKLRSAEDRFNRTRRALDTQITLLRERRQALITAAVTGQLDIPEAA